MRSREDMAEDYEYRHYTCRKHGGFWSDGGAYCEQCGEPELELEEESENETVDKTSE